MKHYKEFKDAYKTMALVFFSKLRTTNNPNALLQEMRTSRTMIPEGVTPFLMESGAADALEDLGAMSEKERRRELIDCVRECGRELLEAEDEETDLLDKMLAIVSEKTVLTVLDALDHYEKWAEFRDVMVSAYVEGIRGWLQDVDDPASVAWDAFLAVPGLKDTVNKMIDKCDTTKDMREALDSMGEAARSYTVERVQAYDKNALKDIVAQLTEAVMAGCEPVLRRRHQRVSAALKSPSNFDHLNKMSNGALRRGLRTLALDLIGGKDPKTCIREYERGEFRKVFGMPEGTMSSYAARIFMHYMVCGEQVFSIGPTMQDMFTSTDLDGLDLDDLKLPYDTFYVALPGRDRGLQGFYVHEETEPREGVAEIDLMLFALVDGNENYMPAHIPRALLPCAEKLLSDDFIRGDDGDPRVSEDAMEGKRTAIFQLLNLLMYLDYDKRVIQVDESNAVRMNNAVRAASQHRRPRAQRRAMERAMSKPGSIVTYIAPDAEDKVNLLSAGIGNSPRPHRVRGHWRLQAYGHGRLLRKKIWIKPFYKRCERSSEESIEREEYRVGR
jgi:hypothetical protein